ncbi:DUF4892 domain-containing protein [Agaribacterium haliotis]|uniref:DUF4892 domain-containing protein n=1 Tax=Agaribacterium haliotis TaxID=2013869 RepID=UPI000BB53306|nr:DUF4892 domain-containing protein [Agaribacterium haliotis]
MTKLGFFTLVFSLVCLSCFARAEQLVDQRLVYSSDNKHADYLLTLSALKNVNAQIVADTELRLRGRVQRQTWEFNSGTSIADARAMLDAHLNLSGSERKLFACRGLACGSSNAWANQRFNIKQLYGLDASQRYQVWQLEQASEVLVLYFVQRGNRRIYAQLDRISLSAEQQLTPTAEAVSAELQSRGYLVFKQDQQGSAFEDELLARVVDALRRKPYSRFYVVGHSYDQRSDTLNRQRALEQAERIKQLLVGAGLDAGRFSVDSVGALVPRSLPGQNRVELVQK